jgi:hypothetical protein
MFIVGGTQNYFGGTEVEKHCCRGFSIKIATKFDLTRPRPAVVGRWPLTQV